MLWNGLTQATVFFYNVDQAVAKRHEIGDKRFRIQGNVVQRDRRSRHQDGMTFDLTYGGKVVTVVLHRRAVGALRAGHPGRAGGPLRRAIRSRSDPMLIRHDNDYDQKNPTRVRDAEKDAEKQA